MLTGYIAADLLMACSDIASHLTQLSYQSCLPANIQATDIVSAELITGTTIKKVTVAQTLNTLQAKCQNTRLVDGNGRGIQFYQLNGCWGTPPPNGREIIDNQNKELAALKSRFTVVSMTCNPGGNPIP
jgi:hypothetical protein